MRIGTRGSALALIQAEWVAARLPVPVEIVKITTLGDRGAVTEDKSRWVSELERALLDNRIDLAVHSAKDVPTELDPELEIVAVPERADPHDAICGAPTLEALAPAARIGTSSVRRAAQIRAVRDDVEVVELRGNVDTRLRKLAEGQVDALVLALAGLQRLGRETDAGGALTGLIPAAGQGALALEGRVGELDDDVLAAVRDPVAMACLNAERTVVHALGASCNTPVGAHARPVAGADRLELTTWVGVPDGSAWLSDRVAGAAASVGTTCAQRMLAAGAAQLLAQAEREPAA
jgi:hydroxymethylbilane synthase